MGFMDMREWMARLEKEGELRRITAEVDWDREIGAIARRVLEKKGPALLFENIKGYTSGRCGKVFVSGLGARSRLALALGFPPRCHQSRTCPARDEEKPRDDRPSGRRHRSGEGRYHTRRGHRPDGVPRSEVALPRRRALHPHLLRHRDQRPGYARDERRYLPRA